MEELKLVIPTMEYKCQVMNYRQECFNNNEFHLSGCAGLEDVQSYEEWLDFENRRSKKYGRSYVLSSVFLAVRSSDNKVVGIIDIRKELSDFLLKYGGNIGYSVLPSERRKGYAKTMLKLALQQCKELGLDKVLLTCDKNNPGSFKTIIANGGILENEVKDDVNLGKSGIIQRYWITLKNNYFEELNPTIKDYFTVLSDEIPDFLYDYINTKEMQRANKIGQACGTYYTKIFNNKFYYSVLDHSIGVALIIWHFTKDKKQTLSGLFHDISTPVFKHCIDFLNGDHETQESTEELTTKMIASSKEIMDLLKRDEVKLEEINDYKLYPIADNDTPKVSADRLEYTLSCGIYFEPVWSIEAIREIYNNIAILKNEDGIIELGFKYLHIAENFITKASKIWPQWICNEDKLTMQFVADTVKKMVDNNYLTVDELYVISEQEVIKRIENCSDTSISNSFDLFRDSTRIGESDIEIKDKYCISVNSKRRYVNPLVKTEKGIKRIYDISKIAKASIDTYLKYKTKKYAYLEFNF